MHIPALQRIRKVKDALGRCHDEHGYLTSCSTSSSGPGQRSLSDFGGKPKEGTPAPAPKPAAKPGSEPASKPAASIDIKAQRTSSGVKYSSSGAALYTSKDGQGDRIISGIRFSKDPRETAAVIERALQDGPIAIPMNIAQSPGGSRALDELHRAGKIREDSASKPGHTIIRPAGGEGRKAPEPKPAPRPEPRPALNKSLSLNLNQLANPRSHEQRPAGSEVDVNTQGAWTSYKIGDQIWLSVANVHGGGRTLMGSKFSSSKLPRTMSQWAVYRAVKDGPLTFPDSMFANQKFREAIQNLEQLNKVVLNDSSNGREKILYEMGPDGRPKEPPQPSSEARAEPPEASRQHRCQSPPDFKPG